jgi:hypothetical protein
VETVMAVQVLVVQVVVVAATDTMVAAVAAV